MSSITSRLYLFSEWSRKRLVVCCCIAVPDNVASGVSRQHSGRPYGGVADCSSDGHAHGLGSSRK
ncbi:hypothetical protein M378DRAFT_167995 [Amanita muscaria Koide BX008]|uniref:Uncharacterized protein n=1 Tax=Amanita muscaria (strain Koide BX008) TaxID=946122 RepID=A0A0C2WUR1_AMAMK|nr:hypothetical protein M378DRAFT_167995 [Amanita muscaria Koide BX008]